MTSTLLFAYAVLLAGPLALAFRRAAWFGRAPALGILAWQALSVSVLVTVALGALTMIPSAEGHHDHHRHVVAVEACIAAVALLGLVVGSLSRGLVGYARCGLVERRRHLSVLGLVGQRDERLDAVVVHHDAAAAYCVPGRDRRVVLTTGAMRALTDEQLAAVLAHEHAHLRGHHHLLVAVGRVLRSAFPFVPAFRWAHDEVSRLVELLADDAAARRCKPDVLASALVTLAAGSRFVPVPAVAFGVAGQAVTGRVRRLRAPVQPLTRWAVAFWAAASLVLLAAPIIGAAPAVALTDRALIHCPFV